MQRSEIKGGGVQFFSILLHSIETMLACKIVCGNDAEYCVGNKSCELSIRLFFLLIFHLNHVVIRCEDAPNKTVRNSPKNSNLLENSMPIPNNVNSTETPNNIHSTVLLCALAEAVLEW